MQAYIFCNISFQEVVVVEDEVEPLLNYNRLANNLKDFLNDSPASCLAVHEKV